ncbi:MAG: patatin-like phospholipase family protein [Syntrophobacteraceae bacterium]|nr:patatin-like phospholipase family protein [Desulfobacteraceae bacterium]
MRARPICDEFSDKGKHAMARNLFKTALALSGGSARALTHLGVLEELERYKVRVDMIVGTSMGAIIGGLYAYYADVATVIQKMRKLIESDLFVKSVSIATEDIPEIGPDGFFNRFLWLFRRGVYYTHSMIRPTLVAEDTYTEIMDSLLPDLAIEDLRLPFASIATDLGTGEEIVLRSGSLRKAVAASAAIPGLLPSVQHLGRPLVDGGWVDNVPAAPAIALGAHFVIAVDATLEVTGLGATPISAIETLFRCNELTRISLTRHRKNCADILLAPGIGDMNWANFTAMERCMSAGRDVFRRDVDRILRKRQMRRYRSLWGSLHPAREPAWQHPFTIL